MNEYEVLELVPTEFEKRIAEEAVANIPKDATPYDCALAGILLKRMQDNIQNIFTLS